jgi:hypothetical protein
VVLVSLAELGAARCQRGRQGSLECQGAQGAGGKREPKASLTSSTLCSAQACSRASTGRLISSNSGDLLDNSTDRILNQQISNRSN